jgi:hypothetical protein
VSTVFLVKGVKPKKLNIAAYRTEILNELRKEGTDQRKELRKTIRTWKGEKPKFETLVGLERPPGSASVLTGPTGSDKAVNKWVWLNDGTPPHVIAARRKPTLAFRRGGFVSKTRPRWFGSRRGSPATGPWSYPKRVKHPGIEARGWSEDLQKRRRRPFTQRMVGAMQRASRKAFP